jgi:FkbM family methyltransferase
MVIERSTPQVLSSNAELEVDFDFLIRLEIARRGSSFSFVQIGGNDGVSRDDDLIPYVREFNVGGVVVEPQPDVFKTLERNYAPHLDVVLLNKAIHCDLGSMTLYRFNQEKLPRHRALPHGATSNGMASFNRKHVVNYAKRLKLDEDVIEEIVVECIGVDDLLSRCDRTPDLIKIDVEGYDYEILEALDLDRVRPSIIRFENIHMTDVQYRAIIAKLTESGYRFLANRMDTTAYLKEW